MIRIVLFSKFKVCFDNLFYILWFYKKYNNKLWYLKDFVLCKTFYYFSTVYEYWCFDCYRSMGFSFSKSDLKFFFILFMMLHIGKVLPFLKYIITSVWLYFNINWIDGEKLIAVLEVFALCETTSSLFLNFNKQSNVMHLLL